MKLYKCWFAGGLMFWPTSRKTYTFKSEEELKKGDHVIAETQNGIAVLIIAAQTNLDEMRNSGCDIPVTKLRHILGKVDMTAYLDSRSPRKQPPKWWQEEMNNDVQDFSTEDLHSPGF